MWILLQNKCLTWETQCFISSHPCHGCGMHEKTFTLECVLQFSTQKLLLPVQFLDDMFLWSSYRLLLWVWMMQIILGAWHALCGSMSKSCWSARHKVSFIKLEHRKFRLERRSTFASKLSFENFENQLCMHWCFMLRACIILCCESPLENIGMHSSCLHLLKNVQFDSKRQKLLFKLKNKWELEKLPHINHFRPAVDTLQFILF